MAEKLKLGPLLDDKPVKATVEFPAAVWRDLQAYADAMAKNSHTASDPTRLIVPMVERFMATDRAFTRTRRGDRPAG
jgi:hypothetical protein